LAIGEFMVRSVALLVALAWSVGVVRAETAAVAENAQAMVGGWEISNTDRDLRCPLSFSVDRAPGGFKVELDAACATAFPSLAGVVAWDFGPKDVLRLLDAKGSARLEFTEVESGMFESERGAEGLLFLQTQASLKADTRTAEQMFGDWDLVREIEKPLCRITLSDASGGQDNYRVVVKAGCDKTIVNFGLATWRLDGDQLLLVGRSGTWRFSESDPNAWERVPLSVDPLLLVRQ
jgi:hypothetical protein